MGPTCGALRRGPTGGCPESRSRGARAGCRVSRRDPDREHPVGDAGGQVRPVADAARPGHPRSDLGGHHEHRCDHGADFTERPGRPPGGPGILAGRSERASLPDPLVEPATGRGGTQRREVDGPGVGRSSGRGERASRKERGCGQLLGGASGRSDPGGPTGSLHPSVAAGSGATAVGCPGGASGLEPRRGAFARSPLGMACAESRHLCASGVWFRLSRRLRPALQRERQGGVPVASRHRSRGTAWVASGSESVGRNPRAVGRLGRLGDVDGIDAGAVIGDRGRNPVAVRSASGSSVAPGNASG